MNLEKSRTNMIEQQIRPWAVSDEKVICALKTVKREIFVPAACRHLAFVDGKVPLGMQQTMLEPKVEARLLQFANIATAARVCVVGAGSGHFAALCGVMAGRVDAFEVDATLARQARQNLMRAGLDHVNIIHQNGFQLDALKVQYACIILTGAVFSMPAHFAEFLQPGGVCVGFVGDAELSTAVRCTKEDFSTFVSCFETQVDMLQPLVRESVFEF